MFFLEREVVWSNASTQSFIPLQMAPAPLASEIEEAAPAVESVEEEEAEVDEFAMDEEDDFDMGGTEAPAEEAPAVEEVADTPADEEAGGSDDRAEGALTRPDEADDAGSGDDRAGDDALTRPEDAPNVEALALEEDLEAMDELPVAPDEGDLAAVGYATPAVADFSTMHYLQDGSKVEQNWSVHGGDGLLTAKQTTSLRTLSYNFIVDEEWGAFELSNVSVHQFGRGVATTSVQFSPALPDLRRPFNGRLKSSFVVDINGQRSNVHGTVEVWWTDAGPKLQLVPPGPEWSAGHDMLTSISYGVPGQASVRIKRVSAD